MSDELYQQYIESAESEIAHEILHSLDVLSLAEKSSSG